MRPGLVPVGPIREILGPYRDQMTNEQKGTLDHSEEGMEFDVADRILCQLGIPHVWRKPALLDIYMTVDLGVKARRPHREGETRCALEGCTKWFKTGLGRRYCSKAHMTRAWRIRAGEAPPRSRGMQFQCRHGHERSPENVTILKSGARRCRICHRERMREMRERRNTHCRNGHVRTPENTHIDERTGKRSCKVCRRAAERRFAERRKVA